MPAIYVHFLIRGTLEYVTFYGKRDFADVFKLRMRRWEVMLDYMGEPDVITKVLIRGRQKD